MGGAGGRETYDIRCSCFASFSTFCKSRAEDRDCVASKGPCCGLNADDGEERERVMGKAEMDDE